ncbi:hypothetical protein Bca4012_052032 [Brassica carinata]|uniref:Uncharacterized protein n=1 Tax=Brassica carinata TaxID=52824 RepID=A0A8X7R7Q5_BRACI|nr:hypothetical protein Bca52824_054581 [Brassica carinata]
MVFREWDPERKRVGIAHEIPNLHQDYGISKQGKVHDDLIRRDQSGLIGLQRNMKKTGIDRGSKILRSTIYTDTCDLGSSSGDGLDNKESCFVAVLSCLLTRRMMYATGGGPKHIWFSIWFGLVVLDY